MLIETLEDEWNGQGANLEYEIDIKDDYLYLEGTKICQMNQLMYCETSADSIIYHLKNNKLLYIVIQWSKGRSAFISQMYIENEGYDDGKILFER